MAQCERGEDVAFELERATHVRAPKAQVARRREHVRQGIGRPDEQSGRRLRRAEGTAVITLDADRKVVAEQLGDRVSQEHGHTVTASGVPDQVRSNGPHPTRESPSSSAMKSP